MKNYHLFVFPGIIIVENQNETILCSEPDLNIRNVLGTSQPAKITTWNIGSLFQSGKLAIKGKIIFYSGDYNTRN